MFLLIFFISGNSYFSFVSTSLAYFTIPPKKQEKQKLLKIKNPHITHGSPVAQHVHTQAAKVFQCPNAWCGCMQWNQHPTEAAWNENNFRPRNHSTERTKISISASFWTLTYILRIVLFTCTCMHFILCLMTIAQCNSFLNTEEGLYSQLPLNRHLYKTDTLQKRTPRVGPCLSLLLVVDSL